MLAGREITVKDWRLEGLVWVPDAFVWLPPAVRRRWFLMPESSEEDEDEAPSSVLFPLLCLSLLPLVGDF